MLFAVLVAIAATAAADEAASVEQLQFFETKIRPLFIQHCVKCHGDEKQEGELRLDSPVSVMRGGASGNTVVAGSPETSLLVKALRYQDEALQMPPPPNKKLDERQIADVMRWVKAGAVMPRGEGTVAPLKQVGDEQIAKGREFWAFRSPVDAPLPAVRDNAWPMSALDVWVLAPLEERGLTPVRPADRRTLLRRATFDLIGLPPTPDELETFLADESPDAFAKLLDRLLASPRYGERWGRHWLDVARYADSNGLDENVAFGNAWRYRDYVVTALNHDRPYDRFLLEQLAGDLLGPAAIDDAARRERLTATGFLSLGPKVLAEVDEQKMEMDIVDEQVDSFGRAIMGLTLGCARCHDHKFDPISTQDYYALAGVFKSTRTMEHFKKVARWHENPIATADELARKAAHEKQLAERRTSIDAFVAAATEKLKAAQKPGEELPKNPETAFPDETKAELKKLRDELAAYEKTAPEISTAMGAAEGSIADVPIHVRGSHLTLGKTVPRRFPRVLAGDAQEPLAADHSGRLQLARWLVDPQHPLTGRVMVNRIWRWHFGQGLVRSTDNFGLLGDRPTNPPLLDWLARRFVEREWSLKEVHRLVMLSSTYQLSSELNPRAAEIDPENRLLGRADVRRLEAEAIRDALLAAGETLDTTMGGSLLHVKNRDYLFDHTSLDKTKYDSRRRSLYLPVIRNNLYDVFSLFDYTDAAVLNGSRDTTTVAPQALFLMNSEFIQQAAAALATRLLDDPALDDSARLLQLYTRTYARPPSDSEATLARTYLRRFETALQSQEPSADIRRHRAWTWLCQTILAANEFVYVR